MVVPTVVHDISTICVASTAINGPVLVTASTEYHSGRTADGGVTETYL